MMYKTQRYGMRGLGGAFDLNATIVPADNQLVAQVPSSGPITASATAYSKIAPLIKPGPAPLTVLKAGTITTLDEAEADPPSGSNMNGPYGLDTVPGVVFGAFDTPAVADSTGTDAASDAVEDAHEDVLDPGVVLSDDGRGWCAGCSERARGPSGRAEDYGVTLYDGARGSGVQRRRPSQGSGWLWALGAVAVVSGVGFVLLQRR